MASRSEQGERKTTSKKKSSSSSSGSSGSSGSRRPSGSSAQVLRNVVAGAVGTDALLDLVERLGLVDLIVGRIKSRIEETDLDEMMEEITDYLRRNPEVLVVTLGAITVTTGMLVWLNNRREWDGTERRNAATSSPGRVKRTVALDDDDDE